MTEFIISIADLPIRVQANFPQTEAFCRRFLSDREPLFSVEITRDDLAVEQAFSARTAAHRREPVREYPLPYLETLAVSRKIANQTPLYGAVLFHGAAIAVDDEVYLFTAQSGTGKTTHMRYWLEEFGDRAVVVNGDKPFLKITDTGVFACGSPWAGKENMYTNTMVPLKSIILMERAEENHIEQISFARAFPFLLQQVYRPDDEEKMRKTLKLMQRLDPAVSFWRFQCNNFKDDCFDVAYNALVKGQP